MQCLQILSLMRSPFPCELVRLLKAADDAERVQSLYQESIVNSIQGRLGDCSTVRDPLWLRLHLDKWRCVLTLHPTARNWKCEGQPYPRQRTNGMLVFYLMNN